GRRGLQRRQPGHPVHRVRRQVPDLRLHPDRQRRLLHRVLERRHQPAAHLVHLRQRHLAAPGRAVAQVESWAAANGRGIQFSYTMPSTTTGMDSADEAVIQNAIADQAKVSVVNLMTFDYYTGTSHEMATATETAASGLHSQLASLYPSESPSQLWSMVGFAEMPGIDDYGSGETFTEADAGTVEKWPVSTGINTCRSGPC